ncbi:MAG: lipoyl(octanoyl) transferase LipB [Gammaproteobacteria bacterium]
MNDPARPAYLLVRRLGRVDYAPTLEAMQRFTRERGPDDADELWVVEHDPVFTQGRNGKPEHILNPGDIPVVPVDRGGQVTYHGPGQLVIYTLLDVRRLGLGVRALVTAIEESIVELLADFGVEGYPKPDAPGVYVDGAKIAALGLRVSRGCSFHGLSLNLDMDLEPFQRINPCGYQGLEVIQLRDLTGGELPATIPELADRLCGLLARRAGYTAASIQYTDQAHD